ANSNALVMFRSAKVIAFSVTSLAPLRALSACPSNALMAWCAAEIKPSKACLACSTLFSFPQTPAFPGEHRSDRWRPQSSPLVDRRGLLRRQGVRPAEVSTTQAPLGSCANAGLSGIEPFELAGRTVTGIARNKAQMRIVDIRECAVPLRSDISNSSFDFSEMTTSVVAVLTRVGCGWHRAGGFGFYSLRPSACRAALRARLLPRSPSAHSR